MIFFLEIFQVYSIIFYKYPNILKESVCTCHKYYRIKISINNDN